MISFFLAWSSHFWQLANNAAVCSTPSGVGRGTTASEGIFLADIWVRGRKYMYICVVNRLGTFIGVIHRVNGSKDSIYAKLDFYHSSNI